MAKNKKGSEIQGTVNIKNRKASFEYKFVDTFEAGIILKGTEIKSIRMGRVTMSDAFCIFIDDELFVRELHISPYGHAGLVNHEAKRDRKLLLKKRELERLQTKMEQKGLTIVPKRIFINPRGYAKMEIALAQGKKLHDKRDSIKDKDVQREMDRQRLKY